MNGFSWIKSRGLSAALITILIFSMALSGHLTYAVPFNERNSSVNQAISLHKVMVAEGEVKFRGIIVDPSEYPMVCPIIFDIDVFYYCIIIMEIIYDPNHILDEWAGPLMVIYGGMWGTHPNAEKAEIGDRAEVYALCERGPALASCRLLGDYHYIRVLSQQITAVTVTSTLTSTVTSYTTITSNTITRTFTGTRTNYITKTTTIDMTRTRTITRTVTTRKTMTTTLTTTISGPHLIIESVNAEKPSYRPGEYIALRIVFRNVGEADNVKLCYGINTQYLGDRWITNCRDLGFIAAGESRTVVEDDVVFATCAYGGCSNKISVKLTSVNNRSPPDPSERSTDIKVIIDEVVKLYTFGEKDYIIRDLRKGEAKSYQLYLIWGVEPYLAKTAYLELTIKRLDGGIFDWDETVDVLLNHYQQFLDRGGPCSPEEAPLRIATNKGWKKFEIVVVSISGGYACTVYPHIKGLTCQRDKYVAEQGFQAPWDRGWSIISKICCALRS